jgi:hypothetical protein
MAKRRRVARPQTRQAPRRTRPRSRWVAAIAALVAVCVATLWLVGRAMGGAGGSGQAATPTFAVAYPTPAPSPVVAAAERRPLPSTTGRPIAVQEYLGRRVVLAFYAEST